MVGAWPAQTDNSHTTTISWVDSFDLEDYTDTPKRHGRLVPVQRLRFPFLRFLANIVGPEKANKPNGSTVLWNLLGFTVLIAFGCVAVLCPSKSTLILCGITAALVFLSLAVITTLDLCSGLNTADSQVAFPPVLTKVGPPSRIYGRNLSNTVLTVFITIPFMTILYSCLWFPNLNKEVMQTTVDTVVSTAAFSSAFRPNQSAFQNEIQFPAIALLQNSNWTSQATLLPNSMKCYLGWMKADALPCDLMEPSQMMPGHSCDCKSSWTNDVIEGFDWQNTTYRYLSWRPAPALIDRQPTYLMTLQAFFTCENSPLFLIYSPQ